MAGYKMISDVDSVGFLSKYLDNINSLPISEVLINPVKYSEVVHSDKKIMVIITPINANDIDGLLLTLKTPHPDLSDYHILLSLVGAGISEQHNVMAYIAPDDEPMQIFDSKSSSPENFFAQRRGLAPLNILKSIFRSIFPAQQSVVINNRTNPYHILGTQSIYDGVSCGYHCATNIIKAKTLIEHNMEVNVTNLLNTGSSLDVVINDLNSIAPARVDSGFLSFIKKAWQDTFMPLKTDEALAAAHFEEYFLGWPAKGRAAKVVYFLTLGFVFNPVVNLIKLPTEFLFNALSQTANYLRNALMMWVPTNYFTQSLRSALLLVTAATQYSFKGISLTLGLVTSPITSAQKALAIHPLLGILSMVLSIVAYSALVVFAAPAAAGLLGPVFAAIALPAIKLLALTGASLNTAVIATGSLAIAAMAVQGARSLFAGTVQKAVATVEKHFDIKQVSPSNAAAAFARAPVDRRANESVTPVNKQAASGQVETRDSKPSDNTYIDEVSQSWSPM